MAEAARAGGLGVRGFTTQAHFLLAAGLERQLEAASGDTAREQLDLAGQVKKLTLPGEMGERFKVIGLSRGCATTPSGFSLRDFRDRL